MQLLKLVETKVQIGVPLPWNVRNPDCTLLLAKDYVIHSEPQLEVLLERGMYVDIEEIRALEDLQEPTPRTRESIYVRWTTAIDMLEAWLPVLGEKAGSLARIHSLATEILELTAQDPDIAIFMAIRQDQARHLRYGYSHSVYTALLSILMARRMGWTPERVQRITLAALTMNASIAPLQGQMAHQEHPVLDRQRAQILQHPNASAQLLERAGVTDAGWLNTVRQHHEQVGGAGYPTGTSTVDEMAQVLRMADIFMARISPRTYRPAMTVQDAARQMFRDDKGGPMSMAVIKELGIYPPGDFVQLASGELGVVMRRGAEARTPLVAAVSDTLGRNVTHTLQRDTSDPAYAVTGTAAAADRSLLTRVPPERLYGYALKP